MKKKAQIFASTVVACMIISVLTICSTLSLVPFVCSVHTSSILSTCTGIPDATGWYTYTYTIVNHGPDNLTWLRIDRTYGIPVQAVKLQPNWILLLSYPKSFTFSAKYTNSTIPTGGNAVFTVRSTGNPVPGTYGTFDINGGLDTGTVKFRPDTFNVTSVGGIIDLYQHPSPIPWIALGSIAVTVAVTIVYVKKRRTGQITRKD